MKNPNLSQEFKRMQELAGIINENNFMDLKLNSKYHQTKPIKDLGYVLTDDDDVIIGDIIWDENSGLLSKSKHNFSKKEMKQSSYWKVIKP